MSAESTKRPPSSQEHALTSKRLGVDEKKPTTTDEVPALRRACSLIFDALSCTLPLAVPLTVWAFQAVTKKPQPLSTPALPSAGALSGPLYWTVSLVATGILFFWPKDWPAPTDALDSGQEAPSGSLQASGKRVLLRVGFYVVADTMASWVAGRSIGTTASSPPSLQARLSRIGLALMIECGAAALACPPTCREIILIKGGSSSVLINGLSSHTGTKPPPVGGGTIAGISRIFAFFNFFSSPIRGNSGLPSITGTHSGSKSKQSAE